MVLNIVQCGRGIVDRERPDPEIRFTTRIARGVTLAKRRHRFALAVGDRLTGHAPPAIRDKIFYPLVSGPRRRQRARPIAIQTFVAQHNGTIEWTSVPDRPCSRSRARWKMRRDT